MHHKGPISTSASKVRAELPRAAFEERRIRRGDIEPSHESHIAQHESSSRARVWLLLTLFALWLDEVFDEGPWLTRAATT